MVSGEAIEQFADGAFGTVLAIYKRRDDRDAQVTRLAGTAREEWAGKTEGLQALVDCTTRKTEEESSAR